MRDLTDILKENLDMHFKARDCTRASETRHYARASELTVGADLQIKLTGIQG